MTEPRRFSPPWTIDELDAPVSANGGILNWLGEPFFGFAQDFVQIGFDLLNLLFNLCDELAFSVGPGCVR